MPIHILNLSNLHFPDGRALIRLLATLPHLKELYTRNLTFDVVPNAKDLF